MFTILLTPHYEAVSTKL